MLWEAGWRMSDLLVWLCSFFILIGVIVMVIYQLVTLADLELDYINPYDSASRINSIVVPELITHGALCCFFLVTGHWVMCLLCLPYLYYNAKMYMDGQLLVDVTEIFSTLNHEKKKRLFKIGYLVVILFFSLFWTIWSALEDDDHMYSH